MSPARPRLSVILISKNEQAHIEACLRSVAFADEIVVLDNGSVDDTLRIARACGARVYESGDWPGFGRQKNRALDWATGDWVLSIDADERVSPALAAEIQAVLAQHTPLSSGRPDPNQPSVYAFSRLSMFCGAYMRHSGWQPDQVWRLFRRGVARFSDDWVHESLRWPSGTVLAQLQSPLLHLSFSDVSEVLDKMHRYSSARARDLHARGKTGGLTRAMAHGLWTFFRTYVLRLGFLDGRRGFILAVSNAEGTYYRYLKMCPDFNKPRGFEP